MTTRAHSTVRQVPSLVGCLRTRNRTEVRFWGRVSTWHLTMNSQNSYLHDFFVNTITG